MELIGPEWKREREVAEEQPALIMIHGSGFVAVKERKDPRDLDEKSRAERGAAYNSGWDKLVVFLGTVSARNDVTNFLVYSRGWRPGDKKKWIDDVDKSLSHPVRAARHVIGSD